MSFRTLALLLFCCVFFVVIPTSFAGLLPFHDDFNDGDASDGSPGTWIQGGQPGATWDASSGDITVSHSGNAVTWVNVQELTGLLDVSITTQLGFLQLSGGRDFVSVWARGSLPHGSYWGGIRDDGLLGIGRTNNDGSDTVFSTMETSLNTVGTDVSLKLDVIGNTISLFAWQAGDSIPDSPQLAAVDTVWADGGGRAVGLAYTPNVFGGNSTGSVAFRYCTVVPEPPTVALLGVMVCAGVGCVKRRRRSHSVLIKTRRIRVILAVVTP